MYPEQTPQMPASLSPQPSSGRNTMLIALVVILGIGAVVFGGLAVMAFGQATTAKNTVEQQKKTAADAARAEQKKIDEQAAAIAAESPFRSYIAPVEYGSFEIKFPKNWSATVAEARSSQTQVSLVVHPDFIHTSNGTVDLIAAKVLLQQKTITEFLRAYDGQKGVQKTDTTVSDIKGVQLTGKFADKRIVRIVVVPIRDKSLVFINESSKYSREFDQILAQSKVLP